MPTTRRRFLAGASALAVLPACADQSPVPMIDKPLVAAPDRPPEPAPWQAPGALDEAAFGHGVQVGDVTAEAALLSVHTTEAELALTVVVAEGEDWVEHEVRSGLAPAEGHLALELTGLAPDTAYRCIFHSPDGARRSEVTRFRTALGPGDFRKVVFGATSCLGSANPTWGSLARLAEDDVDFFLLLGDTVYADGSVTPDDYRAHWMATLGADSFRALCASTSLIATWDDHEVANNWTLGEGNALQDPVTPQQVSDATSMFRACIPQRTGPGGSGLWRKLSWGAVLDVLVLDSRGERDDAGEIVSEEQLAWAVAELRASTATFKVVLASVHLTDHRELMGPLNQEDRWQGYPDQRGRLVEALVEVPGTVVITGDMHYGALQRLEPEGDPGFDVWEVAAGPAGSSLFVITEVARLAGGQTAQYDVLLEEHTSCRCTADPGLGTLTVEFVRDDGTVAAERVLELDLS